MAVKATLNGVQVFGDFVILNENGEVILVGLYDKSRIKLRSATAWVGNKILRWNYYKMQTKENDSVTYFNCYHFPVAFGKGRDRFYYSLCISESVQERYLITTAADAQEDMYSFLLKKTKLPYLRSWMPKLMQLMLENVICQVNVHDMDRFNKETGAFDRCIRIHGKNVALSDLVVFDCGAVTDELMKELISKALQAKEIRISDFEQKPLEFSNFDEYILKYGAKMVKHLEDSIEPLSPLKAIVDNLALKEKALFPPQAACVEGIKALRKSGERYAVLNEGMGVGKTLQSISAVESAMVTDFCKAHPNMTLKEVYEDKKLINYRAIIICPGHLVEKWKDEIEAEIPYAKVTIISGGISQLVNLRKKRKPSGREFYVISKDFAKLGAELSPVPTQVKMQPVRVKVCADCKKEDYKTVFAKRVNSKWICPDCGGHHFVAVEASGIGKRRGLICPFCGELLINTQVTPKMLLAESDNDPVLKPGDFAKHNSENSYCYHCGNSMWGVNVKPLYTGSARKQKVKPPKWRKISYFQSARAKTWSTLFVMSGREQEYSRLRGYRELPLEYGPRRVAPAHFIKKYLKGAFDFCILDEAHKFEGAGTAQANAALALVKASKFTMALTGTISNGTAASFFYLLWLLDSHKMKEKGYTFSAGSLNKFCQLYGCVETEYELPEGNVEYNSTSRGRQIGTAQIKPGISPRVFIDFLMEHSLMLDITDLSNYLPSLHEYVKLEDLPEDLNKSYHSTLDALKQTVHSDEGRASLSVMLQFGLSYPDKPYDRSNIMSAIHEGMPIAAVSNFDKYKNELLPKEKLLVDIVNKELAENRNIFIYASFTGEAETNVTERLKTVIERRCSLKGRVAILQSSTPIPSKREMWIKKKAADGIKVIICNPKVVETGLDFCFTYQGKYYNFPTLIFYQMGYEMSVIWQASRRAYRLCQKEECRNYYLAYANTLQAATLEIMAQKQVATSAIQGKFSTEGLARMARGVDTRSQLAAAMSRLDKSDRKTLSNMFDVLNQTSNADKNRESGNYIPPKTFYELLGTEKPSLEADDIFSFMETLSASEVRPAEEITKEQVSSDIPSLVKGPEEDMFAAFFEAFSVALDEEEAKSVKKRKKAPEKKFSGQLDLFSISF